MWAPLQVAVSIAAIVGGEPVEAGPGAVAAVVAPGGFVHCTGVLVAPDVVWTAAHCAELGIAEVALATRSLDSVAERIEVVAIEREPGGVDVARLWLARDSAVPPLRVAACLDEWLTPGARATVYGWGSVDRDGREPSSELRSARVTVDDPRCTDAALGCDPRDGVHLRASSRDADTCVGDSGGPLLIDTPHGPQLAGLTIAGLEGSATRCGQGGVYARVDRLAPPRPPARCGDNRSPRFVDAPATVRVGEPFELAVVDGDVGDLIALDVRSDTGVVHAHDGSFVLWASRPAPRSVRAVATDDGVPALREVVDIRVEAGPGCAVGGGRRGAAIDWLLMGILAWATRRRRRRACGG